MGWLGKKEINVSLNCITFSPCSYSARLYIEKSCLSFAICIKLVTKIFIEEGVELYELETLSL